MTTIFSYLSSPWNRARRIVTRNFRLHVLEIACGRCVHLSEESLGIESHENMRKDNRAKDDRFLFEMSFNLYSSFVICPNMTRWNIHSMYTAPRMTPEAASTP